MTVCGGSNKLDRTMANRLFRKRSKQKMKNGEEPLHSLNEVSDTWDFTTDGLAIYFGNELEEKYMRK